MLAEPFGLCWEHNARIVLAGRAFFVVLGTTDGLKFHPLYLSLLNCGLVGALKSAPGCYIR